MGAADHAQPTQGAHRIVTEPVKISADSSETCRASCAEGALPLAQVPAALSALLDHARRARGPAQPMTYGPLHTLHTERVEVLEAALLLAGVTYASLAPRVGTEREAAALWTRVARAVAVDLDADVRRIDRQRVAGGKVAQARVRAWDGVVTLATALYEEIGGRS